MEHEPVAGAPFGLDRAVLKGFFVSVSLPSEGMMKERWTEAEQNVEVSKEFSTVPKKFTSRLKTIRSDLYSKILPAHTFKIARTQGRNIYIMPVDQYLSFKAEMVKAKFAELETDITEYFEQARRNAELNRSFRDNEMTDIEAEEAELDAVRYRSIVKYAESKGFNSNYRAPSLQSRVIWHANLIQIGSGIIDQYVGDRAKASIEEYVADFEVKNKSLIEDCLKDVQERTAAIIEALSKTFKATDLNKTQLLKASEALKNLESLATAAQLETASSGTFRDISNLISAMHRDDHKAMEQNVISLAGNLNIDVSPGESMRMSLKRISIELDNTLDPRVKAILTSPA